MPHGGYHGNIKGLGQSGSTQGPAGMGSAPNSNNKPKTDTRPTGMPSFLSSSEPKKSFSQMTSQERTDRFNKNQDKYKQDFKQKIDPIRKPEIPDGSRPKTSEQQSIDDRKLYRQYQDPKVIKATEKAKYTQLEEERRGELGYFPRVGNVNTYFTELAKNAKKTYIQPDASWWEKTLKTNAIDAWYSTGATALGAMEGALGLTLDPVADFVATTVANGNDIWRAANGLPFNAKIKNDVATEVQEHVVGSLMAYWESTGFGAMRTVTGKVPTMSQTANFIKAKVPFEFKNSIKVFNAMKQKKAKAINPFNAKNKVVQADFKMVSEAAVKNTEVKKEIKQLAIQSWEQASVKKYGPIMANNIANHLRQVNSIRPVQAQSVGAAVTPTELLGIKNSPKITVKDVRAPLKQTPFYNGLEIAVNGIGADANGAITLDQVKKIAQVKRFRKHLNVTGFGDKIAQLDAQNVNKVSKDSVLKYLKDNPFELQGQIATAPTSKGPLEDNVLKLQNSINTTHDSVADIHREIMQSSQNPIVITPETSNSVHGFGIGGRKEINEFIENQYLDSQIIQYSSNSLLNKLKENDGLIQNAFYNIDYTGFKDGNWEILDWTPNGSGVNKNTVTRDFISKFSNALVDKNIRAPNGPVFRKQQAWMMEYLNNVKIDKTRFDGIVPTYEQFSLMAKKYNQAVEVNNFLIKDGGQATRTPDMAKFEDMSKTLLANTFAKDLPEWKYYQKALLEIQDSQGHNFKGNTSFLKNIKNQREMIISSPEYKKEQSIVTEVLGGKNEGYVVKGIPKWKAQRTFGPYGKLDYNLKQDYFELRGTTNELKNFPVYRDNHFSDVDNLSFWQLINRREGIGEYKNRTILMAEEIQPTRPTQPQTTDFKDVSKGLYGATGSPFYGSITKRPLFSVETLPDGSKILQSKYDKIQADLEQSPQTSNFDWEKAQTPINLVRFKENSDGSIKVLEEYKSFQRLATDVESNFGAREIEGYVEEGPDAIPNYNVIANFNSYKDFISETEMAMDIPMELIQREMGAGSATGGEANWLKKDLWMGITHAYNSGDAVYAWPTSKTIQKKKKDENVTGAMYDTSAKVLESLGFEVKKIPLWDLGILPPKGLYPDAVHPTEDGKFEIDITPDIKLYYIDRYGDFEAWGVDLDAPQKNGKDTFEILNEGMDVGKLNLDGQTDEMLSTFV